MDETTEILDPYIVFLDDDTSVLDLVSRILKNTGVRFRCFQNPDLATSHILQTQPGIVVLDYLMPEKDGEDILISLNDSIRYNAHTFIWSSTELPTSVNNRVVNLGATPMLKQALFEQDFVTWLCKAGNLKDSVNRF